MARRHGRITGAAPVAGLLATALLAAACTGGDGDPAARGPVPDLGDTVRIAALEQYGSCDAFLAAVRAEALERVGPWGLEGGGWAWPMFATDDIGGDGAVAEGASAPDAGRGDAPATTVPGAGDGREVSGTNVQEEGVDEPDVVKTDGEHLYVVAAGRLHVVDVADPAAPAVRSSTPLVSGSGELLLAGDRLYVLQTTWGGWLPEPLPADARPAIGADVIMPPGPWSPERTSITQLDVSDPTAPRVERTWSVEGALVSARLVDEVARVVVRSNPSARLPFVQPAGPASEEAALTANRAVVAASTIEQWVPTYTLVDAGGRTVDEGLIAPCDRLWTPSAFAGFGMLGVLTIDVADGLGDGAGVGVLTDGETVYASTDHLVVATNRWIAPEAAAEAGRPQMPVPWSPGAEETHLHQFAIDGDGPAEYLASGSVDGHLLDQFSLSEHAGHLRVAVTDGDGGGSVSQSAVVVLERRGDRLVVVGRVDGLGAGERIYAVRFIGDRGFVVTFRQVDPLYALDLSDPTAPRLTGELKIPGYSSYLHPVGEHLLLGVGQDATEDGRVTGAQVSLFDVSDPADPVRVAQLPLGEGGGSEVEWDHRAFLFWDDLAMIPFTTWGWDELRGTDRYDSGAIGLDVDLAGGTLAERGRVTHRQRAGAGIGAGPDESWWDGGEQIRRSVLVDDVVLTVSDRGVLASDRATLTDLGWAPLGR